MSYVNKYTESATYSGGNLIFTLNDGLTYSVNIPSGDTNFANTNLTFTGNRTHNAAGYNLNIADTGHLKVNGVTGSAVRIIIDGDNAVDPKILSFRTGDSQRWAFRVDGADDDLAIRSYDNTGTYQYTPILLKRGTNKVTISSSYELPTTDGTLGQVLTTNGAGVASWNTITGGSTPSLQQVLNVGNTASNNIILTGTNSIQSNNGNGYFYFDDAANRTLVGQNTPGSTYSQLRLSNASAILQSSQGSNNLRSINMDSSGIDISVQSSTGSNKILVDTSNVWIIGTGSFYKLPNTDGLSGQVLTTNGAGQASWATASASLSARLTAWDAYNTNGLLAQTSATTWTNRTITSGGNPITITNGNGVSGNPTIGFNGTYIGTFTASTALVTNGNITADDFIQNSSASIQTTNATLTTLKTIPTVSETIYHIEVTVIGGLTTTNNGYTMKMFLSYKNNGGTVTQIGFGNFFQDSDWTGSFPVALPIISGTNILIQVFGLAGTSIDWYCYTIVRSAPMGVI